MATNDTANNAMPQLGGTAIKPVGWDRSSWESFKYMLFDPDTGKVLTRTPMSWLKITVFYCIYYSLLAGFWLGCLHVFFLTIPDDTPRWTLDESIIGSNPGVGMKPSMSDVMIDSSLYMIDTSDASTEPTDKDGEGEKNADVVRRMDKFMEKYSNNTGLSECADNDDENKGKCIFNPDVLGECGEDNYGFLPVDGMVKPCFFFKLNKIFDFDPKPVEAAELDQPEYEEMSAELKEKITAAADTNQVYFDCFGRFPADMEAVKLKFFPESQGVSTKFFPYTGGNYQSPLMALQVEVRESHRGQLIHLECRAWYKGVVHNKKDKLGLTQFEVMIN
jgi:sodium/potassium-transporting ATPase subunit beta